jgi:spoIIIJ-associated protein
VSSNLDDIVESKSSEQDQGASTSSLPPSEGEAADFDAVASTSAASEVVPSRTDDAVDEGGDEAAGSEPGDFEEDGRADQALDFVVEVLTTMGMDCTVDLMENEETDPPSDVRIEITGKDAHRLIGKKGQTLGALQFIVNRVINRPNAPRRHVLIDSDGYRARRESVLATMAHRYGKQAVSEGKIITFEPMSAQDRRVVHLALAKFPGVVTKSEGKGAARRVQIIPVRE